MEKSKGQFLDELLREVSKVKKALSKKNTSNSIILNLFKGVFNKSQSISDYYSVNDKLHEINLNIEKIDISRIKIASGKSNEKLLEDIRKLEEDLEEEQEKYKEEKEKNSHKEVIQEYSKKDYTNSLFNKEREEKEYLANVDSYKKNYDNNIEYVDFYQALGSNYQTLDSVMDNGQLPENKKNKK